MILLIFIFVYLLSWLPGSSGPVKLGATFSAKYARELGIDSRAAFLALLDDAGARRLRIPVYWDEVEPEEGSYRWEEIDWMMEEAGMRGAAVTLAVGLRVPRWPECHAPTWAQDGDGNVDREKLLAFVRATVERYRDAQALERWQVENEPYLRYGHCPSVSREEVGHEVALVRERDPAHAITMTASGELQRWAPTARQADILGVSLYREVWSPVFGLARYPLPPAWYRARHWLLGREGNGLYVSELQAEPWFSEPIASRSAGDWAAAFTADDLSKNVAFAARTGISRADLWGVEWWYYLREHGEPALWDRAKELFAASD